MIGNPHSSKAELGRQLEGGKNQRCTKLSECRGEQQGKSSVLKMSLMRNR